MLLVPVSVFHAFLEIGCFITSFFFFFFGCCYPLLFCAFYNFWDAWFEYTLHVILWGLQHFLWLLRDSERGRKRKWKFWLSKELKVDFFSFFLRCHSWKVLHKVLYLGFGVRWKRNMRIYIYIYIELFESLEAYSWSWIEIFIYFLNEWI